MAIRKNKNHRKTKKTRNSRKRLTRRLAYLRKSGLMARGMSGGAAASMIITYNTKAGSPERARPDATGTGKIRLDSGQMNMNKDLTIEYKQGQLAGEPMLELMGLEPSNQYLLTMTDPDALGKTWTHWVAVINGSGVVSKPEIASYAPPSPPSGSGIHHYIFRLYESSGVLELPRNLEESGNQRGAYFSNVLEPFIEEGKNKNIIKLILEASYIVDSDKI